MSSYTPPYLDALARRTDLSTTRVNSSCPSCRHHNVPFLPRRSLTSKPKLHTHTQCLSLVYRPIKSIYQVIMPTHDSIKINTRPIANTLLPSPPLHPSLPQRSRRNATPTHRSPPSVPPDPRTPGYIQYVAPSVHYKLNAALNTIDQNAQVVLRACVGCWAGWLQ